MSKSKVSNNSSAKPELKTKDNKNNKTDKKISKLSQSQFNQYQSQKIKQFFNAKLSTHYHSVDIQPLTQVISKDIIHGQIQIPQQSKPVQKLLKSPQQSQVKITYQQMKIYEKQAKRIQHLKLISNLNKQLKNKQPQQTISYILTKQEHQKKVHQIIEQKKQRQMKILQIKKSLEERQIQKQQQQRLKQQQSKLEEKQKKRLEIQQKITKQKQTHIHFLSQQIKHKKLVQNIINSKPLYKQMEQKYIKTIEIPELQQKKKQLKNLRDFKQRYSVDTIKKHEEQLLEKYNAKLQQSKLNRSKISSSVSNSQFKIKFPEKSERLKGLLAQQILKNKMRWTEKNIYIQEKVKREENYLKKLKDQHAPKIDMNKKMEIQNRIIKQKQHLAKLGLDVNSRKLGLEYLFEVKKQASKIKQIQYEKYLKQSLSNQVSPRNDPKNNPSLKKYDSQTLPKLKRSSSEVSSLQISKNNQFFQKIRQKKLNKILNSQQQPQQKLQKLKIQSQKLQQAKQMKYGFLKHNFNEEVSKEASNLALNSIKMKMNLIDLMKKR